MCSRFDILSFYHSEILPINASSWLDPWSVNTFRVELSILPTLYVTVRMFWRTPSWNTDIWSKINVNSSTCLLCVKLASTNANRRSFTAASDHPTCSSTNLIFSCHSSKFSNPCAYKYTAQILVLLRPSSAQVLSASISAHRFFKSSIALSCLKLRDSRKYPTLNVWSSLFLPLSHAWLPFSLKVIAFAVFHHLLVAWDILRSCDIQIHI